MTFQSIIAGGGPLLGGLPITIGVPVSAETGTVPHTVFPLTVMSKGSTQEVPFKYSIVVDGLVAFLQIEAIALEPREGV